VLAFEERKLTWCVQLTRKTSTSVQKFVHSILVVNECKNSLENLVKEEVFTVRSATNQLAKETCSWGFLTNCVEYLLVLLKWPSVLAISPDDGRYVHVR
jgi:hypothetical protein